MNNGKVVVVVVGVCVRVGVAVGVVVVLVVATVVVSRRHLRCSCLRRCDSGSRSSSGNRV